MSTRACIARIRNDNPLEFAGRYHHWDGHPETLGETLFGLYSSPVSRFYHDLPKMLAFLLDAHPAGWSTINDADWNTPPGFDGPGPRCYCHGSRSEKPQECTHDNAAGVGCEYAYVFDGPTMYVLSSYCPDGAKMIGAFGWGDPDSEWRVIGVVDLNGPAPTNWNNLPTLAGRAVSA